MSPSAKFRWGKRTLWWLIGLLGLSGVLLLWRFASPILLGNPFEPPGMAAAHYTTRDVVGDLGGVPVTIPRHFANFVEYEGDPGWGEKRKGPRHERTHQSRLVSFGYDTRFPDMAGESSQELIKDKSSYSIYTTPWISVGITTGNIYPGDGFLDRLTTANIGNVERILKYEQYEPLPEPEHGLTVYAAVGIDPNTKKLYWEHPNAKDIFVHRDKTERVDTYIRCSNRLGVPSQPCTHDFSLEPHMHANVYVSYRRTQLPHWREIQQAVAQQILSFKALPTNAASKP
ncbi:MULTISPECIES: hypothetical protein [Giesbergeria]|uniref:Uncharacterized protein n=1 Tax=Giesbergeria sinuosa TaxID=80883 RepID=A0ABV9Q9T8_9BURK